MTSILSRLTRYPSREEWLAGRLETGIGGSDAAAIHDASPWMEQYELAAIKAGLVKPVELKGEHIEAGQRLEPVVTQWWCDQTGKTVTNYPSSFFVDEEYPFLIGSVDALVNDEDAGLEIKTTSDFMRAEWSEGVPLVYQIQAQHYMRVTGLSRWYFGVLIAGRSFLRATVERNEPFIQTHVRKCVEFWQMVQAGELPEPGPGESTDRAVRGIFASVDESLEPVPLGEEAAALCMERETLKAQLKDAREGIRKMEAEVLRIDNQLRPMIGFAQVGVLPDGAGSYSWKQTDRKGYSVEPASFRKLRFHKPKEKKK